MGVGLFFGWFGFYLQSQLLHQASSMNTQKGEYQLKVPYAFTFRTCKRPNKLLSMLAKAFTEGQFPCPYFTIQRGVKTTQLHVVSHRSFNSSYRTAPATELEDYGLLSINLVSTEFQANNISKTRGQLPTPRKVSDVILVLPSYLHSYKTTKQIL